MCSCGSPGQGLLGGEEGWGGRDFLPVAGAMNLEDEPADLARACPQAWTTSLEPPASSSIEANGKNKYKSSGYFYMATNKQYKGSIF